MSTVSFYSVFLLLSSLIAMANCSSGEILKLLFLGRCCAQHILKTSYTEAAEDKSLFYEGMFLNLS